MLNLLRADIYKVLHTKSYYVSMIVMVAIVSIVAVCLRTIDKMPEEKKQQVTVEEDNGQSVNLLNEALLISGVDYSLQSGLLRGIIVLLSGIVVALGIGGEFKERTIKGMVAKGYKRELIVVSKAIVYMLATFFMVLVTMIAGFVIGTILSGHVGSIDSSSIMDTIVLMLVSTVIYFAYTTVFSFITFALRNVEFSVIVNILVALVLPSILTQVEGLLKIDLSEIRLDVAFNRLAGAQEFNKAFQISSSAVLHGLLVAVVYIIISLVGASVLFKRADIK